MKIDPKKITADFGKSVADATNCKAAVWHVDIVVGFITENDKAFSCKLSFGADELEQANTKDKRDLLIEGKIKAMTNVIKDKISNKPRFIM